MVKALDKTDLARVYGSHKGLKLTMIATYAANDGKLSSALKRVRVARSDRPKVLEGFLKAAVAGITDVVGDDDTPLPWNNDLRERLFGIYFVRLAQVNGWRHRRRPPVPP